MVNLAQQWAEAYMKIHPDISVQVTGGGSGTGIAAIFNGTTMIANMSRKLKSAEFEKAERMGLKIHEYKVALDGIALVVNNSNPIDTLTLHQIREIFSGNIKNWIELGGENREIILYGRENSSGTYEDFKHIALGRDEEGRQIDFPVNMMMIQGTSALGEAIARDPGGIGYGGVGYFVRRKDLKILFVKKTELSRAIAPVHNMRVNYEDIINNNYVFSRYLYCYVRDDSDLRAKSFVEFILSEKGQDVVRDMYYVPLPDKNRY